MKNNKAITLDLIENPSIEDIAKSVPFTIEELARCRRQLINFYKKPNLYDKLLCKLFGHIFITVDYYTDINKEESKVKWCICKRCGAK